MVKKISFENKNLLLAGIVLALVFLVWNLAFKNTLNAYLLHKSLEGKDQEREILSYNPAYLNQKDKVLSQVLKRYTADSLAWKNSFWFNISKAALNQSITIDYRPAVLNLEADSGVVMSQQIQFGGNYKDLVKLLDKLEHTEGLGYIKSLRFETEKSQGADKTRKLSLKAEFTALKTKKKHYVNFAKYVQ